MDSEQAKKRIESMINLIRREAEDNAEKIKHQAENQFHIEKNKILNQKKDKLTQEYKQKLEKYAIDRRIQRSTKINASRLEKMNARHAVTLKIKDETQNQLISVLQKDKAVYKDLLRKMICQGLIKLMEKEVQIRCRPCDFELVESVLTESAQKFKEIIKKETGVDFPINLALDKSNPLSEATVKIGGIVLAAHRGRILCTNTIDNRLDLCFQESIPDIRRILFPDLTPKLPEKPTEVVKHKH